MNARDPDEPQCVRDAHYEPPSAAEVSENPVYRAYWGLRYRKLISEWWSRRHDRRVRLMILAWVARIRYLEAKANSA